MDRKIVGKSFREKFRVNWVMNDRWHKSDKELEDS